VSASAPLSFQIIPVAVQNVRSGTGRCLHVLGRRFKSLLLLFALGAGFLKGY
jgi:hypothetical protein